MCKYTAKKWIYTPSRLETEHIHHPDRSLQGKLTMTFPSVVNSPTRDIRGQVMEDEETRPKNMSPWVVEEGKSTAIESSIGTVLRRPWWTKTEAKCHRFIVTRDPHLSESISREVPFNSSSFYGYCRRTSKITNLFKKWIYENINEQ